MATIIYKQRKSRYKVNHDAFSVITPESAYWIGQMISDGNISENRITLGFSEKDKDHLNKFKSFLKSDHPIGVMKRKRFLMKNGCTIGSNEYFRVAIRSHKMTDDLAKFGVVPNKSLTAKIIHLEYDVNTMRGVIDGDGSVCNINRKGTFRPTISLVGSEDILTQFVEFCQPHIPGCSAKVLKQKNKNIFQVQITGKPALKIMDVLYTDAEIYLDRKYNKVMEILKYHG